MHSYMRGWGLMSLGRRQRACKRISDFGLGGSPDPLPQVHVCMDRLRASASEAATSRPSAPGETGRDEAG